MTEAEAVAQAKLAVVVGVFKILREELQRIASELPPSPQELSREDHAGDNPDVTNEIRRVIQCVLADRLNGGIMELAAAAIYRPVPDHGAHARRSRRKKKAGKARNQKAQGQGRGGA
ncbi:MAG TPA: hypothetical protein VF173_11060 [Thermoanaerobaculia bacterium]|nr:hypothetical protein [Thermoanaerobaculia bacterium]